MLGLEMMLKSMGLNPEEIRKSVEGFGQVVIAMDEKLTRIERKLDAVFAENLIEETASMSLSDHTETAKEDANA